MNPYDIIDKYYNDNEPLRTLLITHSELVTRKAVDAAEKHPELGANIQFIKEAGMLHDIGIFLTDAPGIYCHGKEPYLCHGILGAELMRKENYPRHARVCERHTGAGLTAEEIEKQNLPLPHKDFFFRVDIFRAAAVNRTDIICVRIFTRRNLRITHIRPCF